MKRAFSLQHRLSFGLVSAVIAMWLAGMLAAGYMVRHELDEAFDSALQETAQRILPLAVQDILSRQGAPLARRLAPLKEHDEFLTYVVRDKDGNVLLQSHDADSAHFPETPMLGFRDTQTHRLYGESAVSDTVFIEVAEPLKHRREAAFEATMAVVLPLPVLIPLSFFVVWWIVRRSMRPIVSLRRQIEVRGGGDLSSISAVELPSEISPIATSVNHLMERLRRVLEAERNFTANSAHELRTPIAATLAQTQRLIAEAPDDATRERARQIETSLRQLSRLSEKLMQLARAEGGSLLCETPRDLLPVLRHVLDEFRQLDTEQSRVTLSAEVAAQLPSRMDPDVFAILMRNLIENALKHGPDGGDVDIAVSADGAVHVINGGAPVTATTMAKLTQRFERGATLAKGAGLGLAIADTIARGAGAKLAFHSPATGRDDGFEAVLRFSAD